MSILSERRAFQPYGLRGGGGGARGENLLLKKEPADDSGQSTVRVVNLGGKNTVECLPGDRVRILTPGGGGYGVDTGDGSNQSQPSPASVSITGGSVNQYAMQQETA